MRQKATIDYYQRFIDALESSPQTQKKYIRELDYYLAWLKVSDANKLITPALMDSPKEIRKVEDKIIEYAKFLTNTRKLGSATIHLSLFAIFNFYSINRINLDRKYVTKFIPARKKLHKDRSYTHEQILQLLNSPSIDLKQRVIVLLLASTGMRVGAIPSMTIGALTKVELHDYPSHLYKIAVYEGASEEYYCFCSFECAAMLDQYLGYRQRFGEVLQPKSPLIREQFDPNDTFQVKHPRFLGLDTFRRMIDRMLWSSGLRIRTKKEDRHIHDVMRSHGFRKFAITQMVKSKIDYNVREYLVGHRHSLGLDVNYDRTSEEDRLQEYLKAMDLLTINEENRLRQEVQDKDNVIKVKLEQKDKQISELMQFKQEMQVLLNGPRKFISMLEDGMKTSL